MNNKDINCLIENSVNIPENKPFCAIIGSNPSKGARSPFLWNTTFEKMSLDIKMFPLDCALENLNKLLLALENNNLFIGGAVAAPFKENVSEWLGENVNIKSKKIGAVNCIFRNQNKLMGTNTDGEAAIISMKKNFGSLNDKKILIMGTGGTAKAITAYLLPELNQGSTLTLVGRSLENLSFHKLYNNIRAVLWKDLENILNEIDLIINCTSIGWDKQSTKSPISEELFKLLSNKTKVFDVIYEPNPTVLLSYANNRDLDTLNGLDMNLEQAVIAYAKVNNISSDLEKIKNYMLSAINK